LNIIGSPKASPRNSPFTSPRGSNQWSSRPSVGDVSVSRRGSRFDGVEIRETPNEEEAEMEKSAANTGPSQGIQGIKERIKQQHLTIPNKGMELSSSAETLSGKPKRSPFENSFRFFQPFICFYLCRI
jgi:hypothetical protein